MVPHLFVVEKWFWCWRKNSNYSQTNHFIVINASKLIQRFGQFSFSLYLSQPHLIIIECIFSAEVELSLKTNFDYITVVRLVALELLLFVRMHCNFIVLNGNYFNN